MKQAILIWMFLTTFLIAPAHAQDLSSFIQDVLAFNPEIKAARANLAASDAQVSQAFGNFLPKLDINLVRGNEHTMIGSTEDTLWTRENTFSVTQDLFRGGENWYTYRQNRFNKKATLAQLHDLTQQVSLRAITAYINVLRNRQLVAKARANVNNHRDVLKDMKLRMKHKAGRRGEVQLAEARLALAESRLDQFKNELDQARYVYKQTAGYFPPRHLEAVDSPSHYLPLSLKQAVMVGLSNNPEIKNSRQRLGARQASKQVERSKFLPKLQLRGELNYRDNINGVKGRNNSYFTELNMSYNVFNGGSDWASWNQAAYQAKQAMHDVDTARRNTIQSVESNWSSLKTSLDRIKRFRRYVRSTQRVVEDYYEQFRVGRRPLFNVLDAERENFRARVSYINARYNYTTRGYRLLASTGRLINVLNQQLNKQSGGL